MSTNTSPCYRDDALQYFGRFYCAIDKVYPFFLSLCDFDVEDYGDFPVPVPVGNLKKNIEEGNAYFTSLLHNDGKLSSRWITTELSKLPPAIFGISSVFYLLNHFKQELLRPKPVQTDRDTCFSDLFTLGLLGSQHTRPDIEYHRAQILFHAQTTINPIIAFTRDWLSFSGGGRAQSYQAELRWAKINETAYPSIDTFSKTMFPMWKVLYFGPTIIAVHPMESLCVVLLPNDITRFLNIVRGIGLSRFYAATYYTPDKGKKTAFINSMDSMWDYIITTAAKLEKNQQYKICRALDIYYNMEIAEASSDVSSRAKTEQQKKWNEEEMEKVFSLRMLKSICVPLKFAERLEVISINKSFPVPDYCQYSMMQKQKLMYEKPNELGEDSDLVFQYYRWLMIDAYYKKHGQCPGKIDLQGKETFQWCGSFPYCKPSKIKVEEVKYIDFTGSFLMTNRTTDLLDLVKDKAICPTSISGVRNQTEFSQIPISERNYLLNVLTRDSAYNLDFFRENNAFWDVKAEDKAEAKKLAGRWFFELHSVPRLLLSEYEASITAYAKELIGFTAGKNHVEKVHMMNHVTHYEAHPDFKEGLFISFDLEKWSPHMNPAVHKVLDSLWANAFGQPYIENLTKVYTEGNIHYIKNGIHHVMKKTGADFEGFAGKKLTLYHLAVMYATLHRLRDQGFLHSQARFASLIDDGLLKLFFKPGTIRQHLQSILTILEETYADAGLKLSWDKTFVSTILCVFLAEIRVLGHAITPGNRAYMKITPISDIRPSSILEDMKMLESTCRGAITAGAMNIPIYALYCYYMLDIISKWGGRNLKMTQKVAYNAFCPIALGGCEFKTMQVLLGSLTAIPIQEQLRVIQFIATKNDNFKAFVNTVINTRMRKLSPTQSIYSGMPFRQDSQILSGNRLIRAVSRYFTTKMNIPLLKTKWSLKYMSRSEDMLKIAMKTSTLSIETMEVVKQASFQLAVDEIAQRIIKSSTVRKLLPHRQILRIMLSNRREARLVLAARS